jgi:hypothetical protein
LRRRTIDVKPSVSEPFNLDQRAGKMPGQGIKDRVLAHTIASHAYPELCKRHDLRAGPDIPREGAGDAPEQAIGFAHI